MNDSNLVKPFVGVSIVLGTLVLLKKIIFRPKWSCQDKTVLITGASSGIGASLSRYYAKRGSTLYIVARRKENLERIKQDCINLGAPSVTMVVADVATEEGWASIRKSLTKPLDLLCLNAGLSMGSDFTELSRNGEAIPIMKRLMDVNYMGSVGVLDACLPQMLQSNGGVRMIVVSSVIGLVATPSRTGYAASKFALKGFFDSLRCELQGAGTKNTITLAYPGAVRTEINASRLAGSEAPTALSMDKALTPDECAAIMAEGHAAGDRDVYYSMDGTLVGMIKSRLIMHLAFWAPSVADMLIIMTMKQMTKK